MAVENDSTGLSPPHLMEVEFGEQGPLGIEFAWPFVAGVKQGSAAELAGLGFGMRVVSIAGAECAADMGGQAGSSTRGGGVERGLVKKKY